MQVKLTDLSIRQLPNPTKGHKMYWDAVVPGFGVRVTARSKSYFIVYGKERRSKTLGKYPSISLKNARTQALQFQAGLTSPSSIHTLKEARRAYLAECETKNAPKTVEGYTHRLGLVDKHKLSDITKVSVRRSRR